MKIYVVTGQRGADIVEMANKLKAKYQCKMIKFPETKPYHSYDLCDYMLGIVHGCYENNENLVVVTYSEVVLDSVRLWVARNKFTGAECINVLSNNDEIVNVEIDENGEMEQWVRGVFDIKRIVLKELLYIRRSRK